MRSYFFVLPLLSPFFSFFFGSLLTWFSLLILFPSSYFLFFYRLFVFVFIDRVHAWKEEKDRGKKDEA